MTSLFWIIFFFFVLPSLVKMLQKKMSAPRAAHIVRTGGSPFNLSGMFDKIFPKQSTNNSMNNIPTKLISTIILIIIGVIIILNIIVAIPAGTTGVRTLFGKVQDRELSSGLNIVNPLEKIIKMSIRTEEYTMSVAQGEGNRQGADQITALTNEGLPVDLDITVFYRLNESDASEVYRELGTEYQEKIIRPEIRSAIREVVAKFDAKAIYSEKRNEVAEGIRGRLEETLTPRGITVEQVLMRNVTLPSGLAGSIQQKLQAEQDAQRLDFVLEKELKEAERKRIEAQGQSDAQSILNQTLTPRYLQYLYISELKDREGTIYVPTGGDGLPLFRSVQ